LLFMVLAFIFLLLFGMPIGFTVGLTGIMGFLAADLPNLMRIVPQRFYSGVNYFTLLAIPFFILAGSVMNKGQLTGKLITLANVLVGQWKGGLAQVNVLASIFFAGITGAAVSDSAALGALLIPAMEEQGYDRKFAAAVTASSSIIGPIIPPSIIMVIYGSLMGVTIAGLFSAGLVVGILLGLALMVWNYIISKKRDYPVGDPFPGFKELLLAIKTSLPALVLPFIILGGIMGGVFTPTEAAAVAAFYAIVICLFFYRTITFKDLFPLLKDTITTTGLIFLLMGAASILSWYITNERIPQAIALLITEFTTNRYLILLMINIFLLIVGMFMDITAALIILAPILAPVAVNVGVHPFHFAIIMVVNLNIALMTPPIGGCLFVVSGVGKVKMEELSREIFPFILIEIFILLVITFIPEIPLFLPRLLGFI